MGQKIKVPIPLNDWGNDEEVDIGQFLVSDVGDRSWKPILLLDEPLHDDTDAFRAAIKRIKITKFLEYN